MVLDFNLGGDQQQEDIDPYFTPMPQEHAAQYAEPAGPPAPLGQDLYAPSQEYQQPAQGFSGYEPPQSFPGYGEPQYAQAYDPWSQPQDLFAPTQELPPQSAPFDYSSGQALNDVISGLHNGEYDDATARQMWNTYTGDSARAEQDAMYGQYNAEAFGGGAEPLSLREQGIQSGAFPGLDPLPWLGEQARGGIDLIGQGIDAVGDMRFGGSGLMAGPVYDPQAPTFGERLATPTPYRDEISGFLGDVGEQVGRQILPGAEYLQNAIGAPTNPEVGRFIGDLLYPQNVGQAALELLPGVGAIPGGLSFADDFARIGFGGALDNVLRGGADNVLRAAGNALPNAGAGGADELLQSAREAAWRYQDAQTDLGKLGGLVSQETVPGSLSDEYPVESLKADIERRSYEAQADYQAAAGELRMMGIEMPSINAPPSQFPSSAIDDLAFGGGNQTVADIQSSALPNLQAEEARLTSELGPYYGQMPKMGDEFMSMQRWDELQSELAEVKALIRDYDGSALGQPGVSQGADLVLRGGADNVLRAADNALPDIPMAARLGGLKRSYGINPMAGAAPDYNVFQGIGRTDIESVYGAVGREGEILGSIFPNAKYYAFSSDVARQFGPDVAESSVRLDNPILLSNDEQWRVLTQAAGQQYLVPEGLPIEQQRLWFDSIGDVVKAQGHDGIVIQLDTRGENARRLSQIFGDDQVIVFDKQAAELPIQGGADELLQPGVSQGADFTDLPPGRSLPASPSPEGLRWADMTPEQQAQTNAVVDQVRADLLAERSLRNEIQDLAGVERPPVELAPNLSPEEAAIADETAERLRLELSGVLPVSGTERDDWLLTIRGVMSSEEWNTWREWTVSLPEHEQIARAERWMQAIDAAHVAPDMETRMSIERSLLGDLRQELSEAMQPKMQAGIGRLEDIYGRPLSSEEQAWVTDRWEKVGEGVQAGRVAPQTAAANFGAQRAILQGDPSQMPAGARVGSRPPGGVTAIGGGAGPSEPNGVLVKAIELLNLPRSLMAGMDLSYALRQGSFLAPSHLNYFRQAAGDMAQALVDGPAAARMMDYLTTETAWAKRGIDLHMVPIEGGTLLDREGAMVSSLTEKLPIVGGAYRATNRGNAMVLNSLRSSVMDDFIQRHGDNVSKEYLQHYANYVERATGRGSLKFGPLDLENAAGIMGNLLFSARFTASIPQRVGYLNPMTGGKFMGPIWREAVQDHVSFFATGATVLGLAALAGATVQLDPRQTDFGRIRVGDSHIDIWGGFQPYARAIYQAATGQKINTLGDLKKAGPGLVMAEFLRNKLAPQTQLTAYGAGLAAGERSAFGLSGNQFADFVRPEHFRGGVFDTGKNWDQIASFLVPLWFQEIVSGVKYGGLTGGLIGGLSTIGIGTQAYPDSVWVQRKEQIEALLKDPSVREQLPGALAGKQYSEFRPKEQHAVLEILGQRNPELAKAIADERRELGGAVYQAQIQRAALAEWKSGQLDTLMTKWAAGEVSISQAVKDLQNRRAAFNDTVYGSEKKGVVGIYQTSEYKAAVEELNKKQESKREPGDLIDDLLSSRSSTPAGALLDLVGGRRNETPGNLPPGPSPAFNDLVQFVQDLPAKAKGPDGYTDYAKVELVRDTLIQNLPEHLGERLRFNLEKEPPHPMESLYFNYINVQNQYDAVRPVEGANGKLVYPQGFDGWLGWLKSHPAEEATLFLFGGRQTVTTHAAADIVHQIAPGQNVVVRLY